MFTLMDIASTMACSAICCVMTVLHTAVLDTAGAQESHGGTSLIMMINDNYSDNDNDNDIPDGDIYCEVTGSSWKRGWEIRDSPPILDSIQQFGEE